MMVPIVAFLQNPWFRPGTAWRHIEAYRDNQDFHQRLLANTMSGGRLSQAFGDLYERIWWDNTNWRPAWESSGKTEPDYAHIKKVIVDKNPRLILAFGRQAEEAVMPVARIYHLCVWHCPHPNARHFTNQQLTQFAERVKAWTQNVPQSSSDHQVPEKQLS